MEVRVSTEVATVDSHSLIDLTAAENRELQGLALDISISMNSLRYALVDMGKACIRAHEILAPKRGGAFAEWVDKHTEVSFGWAYGAMRVFRRFGDIAPGCKIDSKALLLLASPGVPAEVVEAAIELSETEPVTARKAKELINEHRMEVVRDEPPEAGSADDDRGIEPDVEDEPEPVAVKAKAKPPEQNDLGEFGLEIDAHVNKVIDRLYGKPEFWRVFARERLSAAIDRI